MKKEEFLFDWTLSQVALLVEARLDRDERGRKESEMSRDGKSSPRTIEDYLREMNE